MSNLFCDCIGFVIFQGKCNTSLHLLWKTVSVAFQINDMMNNINSYRRKSLCGKSPYEIERTMLPDDFFVLLGIEQIKDKDIVLDPSLLK